jgi:hypothetical protein
MTTPSLSRSFAFSSPLRGGRFAPAQNRRGSILPLLSCILSTFLLFSCLPDPLEVENIPAVKSQIVVSSQIISDQSLLILLTKTVGALEASDDSDPDELIDQIAVNDAVATITGPTGIDTLIFLGNGLYGGIFIPFQQGASYTLNVKSESIGEVKATTTVKPLVSFKDIEATLYHNGFNDTLAQITYTLQDPTIANWYMINVQEVERTDLIENVINPRAFTKVLDDAEFNGQEFGEQFRVFPRDYEPGDTIAVSLSNISEDYFRFMELRIDNRFSFVEFLGEPINYPSNVEGGKGFFNLYVPDVRIFVLE